MQNRTDSKNLVRTTSFYAIALAITACGAQQETNPRQITPVVDGTQTVVATDVIQFGGMYGYALNNNIVNPFTGASSCPTGFTASQIYGTERADHTVTDHSVFMCTRQAKSTDTSLADFGGMYGNGSPDMIAATHYANPLTGAQSCPTSFTQVQILNTNSVDWDLHYCYRQSTGDPTTPAFGGAFGMNGNGSSSQYYNNPITGQANCSSDFNQVTVFGAWNTDWPLYMCVKK